MKSIHRSILARSLMAGASLLAIVLGSGDANAVVFGGPGGDGYIIPSTDITISESPGPREDQVGMWADWAQLWAASCSSTPAIRFALSWAAAATWEFQSKATPVAEAEAALCSVAVVCCLLQAAVPAIILGRHSATLE